MKISAMDKEKRKQLGQQFKDLEGPLEPGAKWYLVCPRWYHKMESYLDIGDPLAISGVPEGPPKSGFLAEDVEEDSPGPIDLGSLLDRETHELRGQMIDNIDYCLVNEPQWKLLLENFGLSEGQERIERRVITHGLFMKHNKVEVYFMPLEVGLYGKDGETKVAKFSKIDTVQTIEDKIRELFEIPENREVRLWSKMEETMFEEVGKPDQTVQDAGLYANQCLVAEQKNEDGTWPRDVATQKAKIIENANKQSTAKQNGGTATTTVATSNNANAAVLVENNKNSAMGAVAKAAPISTRFSYSSSGYDGNASERAQPGLCGLSNLGNTCFMNSIIQGLSNCPPVTEYFANDNYMEDINEDNPLGMKGEIATAFGELIKSMWSGKFSYIVPRNFKMAVGRFAPQFSGYQQHDSQELLTFLLDGLHEDLNRVKKKPYIEIKDSNDRPDEEVAGEAWDVYKVRNDSVILDLFHGLLKSTVDCPECPKVSVTFDPFCYLSLPLPVKKERKIDVFLVYADPARCPKQFKVTVAKSGRIRDLTVSLSELTDSAIPPAKMTVTDVYNHRFHKIYSPDEPVTQILDRDDVFVYETTTSDPRDPDTVVMPVYFREKKTSASYSPSNLFGQPLLVGLPRQDCDYERLYEAVLSQLTRYVTRPKNHPDQNLVSEWWKPKKTKKKSSKKVVVNGVGDGENSTGDNSEVDGSAQSTEVTNGEKMEAEDVDSGAESDLNEVRENGEEEDEDEEDDGKGPPKLFVMNYVNSYGNSQIEQLENNGEPLKIFSGGKNYLALDWHPKAKELFYNEKAAEDIAQDKSFDDKPTMKKSIKLEDCLELYTTQEKLGEDDAWYCPNCKKHQQATKKFDLWSLPGLLVISLKRFSYNRYWRDKLDTMVEFPVHGLDMGKYVINKNHGPAVYDLVAVSNHYGGMGGGHYTAYAKNRDDGLWHYFDDSSVTRSSEDACVTKAAYVLFYQRRDLQQLSRPSIANRISSAANNHANSNGNSSLTNGANSSEDEEMDTN